MHEFPDQIRALADGPHAPEQTVAVARTVEEALRVLVYATRADAGIGYASTLYDLVGALQRSAHGMEQVIRQVTGWLAEHENELTADGCDRFYALYDVYEAGAVAGDAAGRLDSALNDLHSCLAVIGGPVSEGDPR